MIIDRFAGPGGWDAGLRMLGRHDVVGVEWDEAACATARANGFVRVQADVSRLDPRRFVEEHCGGAEVDGGIDSPPCQGFSPAGLRLGVGDTPLILQAVEQVRAGLPFKLVLLMLRAGCEDPRSALVLEPLRWALALRPRWLAWEQVTPVLPLWEACADVLRSAGYSVWTGNVHAEQYGVPQTRKRAALIANRTRPVGAPVPTHSRYYPRTPDRLDDGVLPWVSMAQALGADGPWTMRSNYGTGGDPAARGLRGLDQPAPTVTSKIDRNLWQPTPANDGTTAADMAWTGRRPSPTIVGSFAPGYRRAGDGPRQSARGSVRVTLEQAAVLQSFPADYAWCGSRTAQFRQVGDAVPPLLAAHLLMAAGALDGFSEAQGTPKDCRTPAAV